MSNGKIDGGSVAEQVIAGVLLVGITGAAVHAYDKLKERQAKRPKTTKGKRR